MQKGINDKTYNCMQTNSKPLKVHALPLKNGTYAVCLTFSDGQQCSDIYKPSKGDKWIPAPYEARSINYKKTKKVSNGFWTGGGNQNIFDFWETETTVNEFVNNPPAFVYVDHKAAPPALTPKFKSDYDTIKYLLKELVLIDVRTASGAAFFTHTKGSFSFKVVEDADSKNDGTLTYSQVRELNKLVKA